MNITKVVDLLGKDSVRNINLLNFIQDYPVHSYHIAGNSVLFRGTSDRPWVFISSNSRSELAVLRKKLGEKDTAFAAIEHWMVPFLTRGRKSAWDLNMTQFILPAKLRLPDPSESVVSLTEQDASYVYENSGYRDYLSLAYIRDRIARGPSAAIYKKGRPVAWAMTQDDGAMGFLHVLNTYREKGYGSQITWALSQRLKSQGKAPFAYVEKANEKAKRLVTKLGFIEQKQVHWFQLQ